MFFISIDETTAPTILLGQPTPLRKKKLIVTSGTLKGVGPEVAKDALAPQRKKRRCPFRKALQNPCSRLLQQDRELASLENLR
jgi:hypothetical protein